MTDIAAASPALDGALLGRGVVAGAVLMSAAFLAGVAVLARAAVALTAFLAVAFGGALAVVALGLAPAPSPTHAALLAAAFGASGLLFISAAVGPIRENAALGGVLFAAAISLVGIGVINVALAGEAANLLKFSLFGAGAAAGVVVLAAALRGDGGAQLIAPGVALAGVAPAIAPYIGAGDYGVGPVAAQAIFVVGFVSAGVLAATEAALGRARVAGFGAGAKEAEAAAASRVHAAELVRARASAAMTAANAKPNGASGAQPRVSENKLAEVLDYAGVAVWDWSPSRAHQSESFAAMMGSETRGLFTPDALRNFVHPDDKTRLERDVLGVDGADDGFDVALRLVGGRRVRLRGARAVAGDGELERIIVFLEPADAGEAAPDGPLATAASALAAAANAAAPGGVSPSTVAAALDAGGFSAIFQPIVRLRDKETVGYEALLRWSPTSDANGVDGALADAPLEDVVRAAILAGRGGDLARMMVEAAARKAAAANRDRPMRPRADAAPIFCAVNVSASQALTSRFVDDVRAALDAADLPRGAIVVELTEAERLDDVERAEATFKALRELGVGLAFDDFGAGFSSLAHLHRFSFDYLKIDKSFAAGVADDKGAAKIVAALCGLARDFGMTVIAEGVEDARAASAASVAGCALAQGFHFGADSGPPMALAPPAAQKSGPDGEATGREDGTVVAAAQAPTNGARTKDDVAKDPAEQAGLDAAASKGGALVLAGARDMADVAPGKRSDAGRRRDAPRTGAQLRARLTAAARRADEPTRDGAKQDASKLDGLKRDGPKRDGAKRGETTAAAARRDDAGEVELSRRDRVDARDGSAARRRDEPLVLDADLQAAAPSSRRARRKGWRRDLR
ncbi:MAG: EAL domain-containing protein [Parvularculaceae bacterium]